MLISSYSSFELRQDKGILWEKFLISERLEYISYNQLYSNIYFWRRKGQAEIDYLEDTDSTLHAYEIKWKQEKASFPNSFLSSYPNHETKIINQVNYEEFIRE